MAISRARIDGQVLWLTTTNGDTAVLPLSLAELLGMPVESARRVVEGTDRAVPPGAFETLVPIDEQEVWAAGVTYRRSRDGRMQESTEASIYDRVYRAPRPELFLKATAGRVIGDGDAVGIRADSTWDVPEPELAIVINSRGEQFGYLVGNDMSSRSIEGDNPLYLPQAKVYERACAVSSSIVPIWDASPPPYAITMSIQRDDATVFAGETSSELLARDPVDLIEWLRAACDFPSGVVLLTGTGIVPPAGFTLRQGDTVSISIVGIGSIANPVITVGRRIEQRA
jgi:2-dehydro-3-deoxy-D-arabinonate dehydratase